MKETEAKLCRLFCVFCNSEAGGVIVFMYINPLPNDEISDQSKLNDKLKVVQIAKFVLAKIENIVGKEENAG